MDLFFPFNFIIYIIVIATIGKVAMQLIESRSNQQPDRFSNKENEQRFKEMEARLQVLERIVTDSKTELRDKIDAL